MTRGRVERFFRLLAERYGRPARILLVGGGASIVQAEPRFTEDLDFEVRTSARAPVGTRDRKALESAIAAANRATGVKAQYSDRVERWSMIPWPGYERHTRLWKRFGACTVHLLEPEYFALSKLARGTATDQADIVTVLRRVRGSWRKLATLCGRAHRAAPMSNSLHLFRLQVERFFTATAPKIWGRTYRPDAALSLFYRSCRRGHQPA